MSEVAANRSPPSFRYLILLGFWSLILIWMGIGTTSYLASMVDGPPAIRGFPDLHPGYEAVPFAVYAWGFAANLIFGLAVQNPFKWLNGKRLIFGCLALAVMLGSMAFAVMLVGLAAVGVSWFLYTSIPVIVFIATPLLMLATGVVVILSIATLVFGVFTFFVGIPVMLFNQILAFENAVHVYRFKATGLAGYIIPAVYWLRNEAMPKAPPDDSRGARFATWPEVSQLHQAAPESMAFGHVGQPFFLKTDKHVLIMASTRSGKGVTLIIPHLLRYQGSAFVLDPKAENAKATGRRRAQLNRKVHYLDPFGISGKPQSRFNPLSRFTPENMEAESKALAAALFVVDERQRDHWTASAQQLLATLILYVYASPDFGPLTKDLPMVRQLLLGHLQPALEAMMQLDEAGGLLRDLAMSFITTPEKEFGSIVSAAQRQTEILDNPYMVACLSAKGDGPEVDFTEWRRGTMTVFLCLSAPKFPTFNRWLRLVLTSALDDMTNTLNPPKLPVCFMVDELATLGRLPSVENAVGLAAGYGIQLVAVFQDIAQMRDLYKGRWASFIGNAGVRALFNLDDFDTADYWSKFVGAHLVETRSRQQDIYGLSKGDNVGETMRQLIPPDQMMLDFASKPVGKVSKMLVLAQGAHPVVTDRIPYWNDASLQKLWDDPRVPVAAQPTAPRPMPPPPPPTQPPSPQPPPRPNGPGPLPHQAAAETAPAPVSATRPAADGAGFIVDIAGVTRPSGRAPAAGIGTTFQVDPAALAWIKSQSKSEPDPSDDRDR